MDEKDSDKQVAHNRAPSPEGKIGVETNGHQKPAGHPPPGDPVSAISTEADRQRQFSEISQIIKPSSSHTGTTTSDGSTKAIELPSSNQADTPSVHVLASLKRWVCDLGPKKRRIIIGVIVFLIIVAIVVPVALKFAPKDTPVKIYQGSKLAVISWMDEKKNIVTKLFYQMEDGTLMSSESTPGASSWLLTDISQSISKVGSPINPILGTPLAATAPDSIDLNNIDDYWQDLYFMTSASTPANIWTWDVPQKSWDTAWHTNTLQTFQKPFTWGFMPGTQLAAYRDECLMNCSQSSRLLYQDGHGNPVLAWSNVSNWAVWQTSDLSADDPGLPDIPPIEPNSTLALVRVTPEGAGDDPSEMRAYFDVSHQLIEYIYNNRTWTKTNNEWALGDSDQPPSVSAISYAAGTDMPLNNIMLAILLDDGSITVHWSEQQGDWQTGYPSGPVGVSALAISNDVKAFCLEGDRIVEYNIDRTNPSLWVAIGNVTTP